MSLTHQSRARGFVQSEAPIFSQTGFSPRKLRPVLPNSSALTDVVSVRAVSYTHLDVYKRQVLNLLSDR